MIPKNRKRQASRTKTEAKLPGKVQYKGTDSKYLSVKAVIDVSKRGISLLTLEAVAKGSSILVSIPGKSPIELEVIYCNFEAGTGEPRYRIGLFARSESINLYNLIEKSDLSGAEPSNRVAAS